MKLLLVLAVLCSVALAQIPSPQPLPFNWRELKNIWSSPRLEPALKRMESRFGLKSIRQAHQNDLRRIVGGENASLGQFPFSLLLVVDDMWWCGCSLINANYALTAAHCIYQAFTASMYTIVDLNDGYYWTTNSARLTIHEHYDDYEITNDIGLIRTATPAPNNAYTSYITLPRQYVGYTFVDYDATIQGFGRYSDASEYVSETKRFVGQTIVSNQQCSWPVYDNELCTDTTGGRGPCNGDSGGGLFVGNPNNHTAQRMVVGIVSFGALAGCELGYEAVFTRVTDHLNWIDTHMQ